MALSLLKNTKKILLNVFLRVSWTARRSNQSILNEISPGCSLEGLMLKLKLQYFGHLMQRADSLEKTLMLGGIGGRRRRGRRGWDGWMASLTRWTWLWVNSRSLWWTGRPGVLWFTGSQRVGHDWGTELNWTECFFNCSFLKDVYATSLANTESIHQRGSNLMKRQDKYDKLCSVAQSHPTLFNPMDYSLLESSVHGISQARILERVAISSSRGSSWPRGQTCILHLLHWRGILPLHHLESPQDKCSHGKQKRYCKVTDILSPSF